MSYCVQSDINAILARKSQLASHKLSGTALTMERSRLAQARTLASRRQDHDEVKQLDARIAELDEQRGRGRGEENKAGENGGSGAETSVEDLLAKVNERNRKANAETRRNVAAREEKKRRERNTTKTRRWWTGRALGYLGLTSLILKGEDREGRLKRAGATEREGNKLERGRV